MNRAELAAQLGLVANAPPAQSARHARLTHRFATACGSGATAIERVLTPDAILVADGGGAVTAAMRPIRGASNVARYLEALLSRQARSVLAVEHINGRSGLVLRDGSEAIAVATLGVSYARVRAVWIVLNPEKLRPWQSPA